MDESQYQLGIRKLSTHELITLISVYRNELIAFQRMCKSFAQENLAQEPLHKLLCAQKEAQLGPIIQDYNWAIRQDTRGDEDDE